MKSELCGYKISNLFSYKHLLEDQPHEMKYLVFMGVLSSQFKVRIWTL